jgi:GDP-L-fucose synthase
MNNAPFSLAGKKVWVAGHRGMVGSAIVRRLEERSIDVLTVGRNEADLRRQDEVEEWMAKSRPDVVFLAAARVGGILANSSFPASFIYDNLMIEANIIHAAFTTGVSKLLFLGSTCIYPKYAKQPIDEEALLTGPLEPTNEWYAVAKIAGIKLVQAYRREYGCDFISAMPTNLYGQNDNFDLKTSHVLSALMHKIYDAKSSGAPTVEIWGTGTPRREFLHVDDAASACVFLVENYSDSLHINIGTGVDLTISELAERIAKAVGYEGSFVYDTSKPDGPPRKCSDPTRIRNMGWAPAIDFESGLRATYEWFVAHGAVAEHQ